MQSLEVVCFREMPDAAQPANRAHCNSHLSSFDDILRGVLLDSPISELAFRLRDNAGM
jgi:hypothetical protein